MLSPVNPLFEVRIGGRAECSVPAQNSKYRTFIPSAVGFQLLPVETRPTQGFVQVSITSLMVFIKNSHSIADRQVSDV
ncbi:hypothetical protein HK23_10340 [Acetobacter malorum]|uniref:Uncharacterized protein n=1 Tax=Acetobacter malorum TaxID=178901 RepID=A0A1Y3G6K5_9PROT|nr:hypothetical protein HK23_10340 [Acetobacter malorum]